MSLSKCCVRGFKWDGEPQGRTSKLGDIDTYIAGNNPDHAVLLVHDAFGWTFPNARLLADHYAQEANATVYLPDFFNGEVLDFEPLINDEWDKVDLVGLIERNSREIRDPTIFAAARALRRDHHFKKVVAIGFCYGGWAVFRLGADPKYHPEDPLGDLKLEGPLVDAISMGHPSFATKEDIDRVAVPVQLLAPEIDKVYTPELKQHTFTTLMKKGVPFDYQHFPGVVHGSLVRGDNRKEGERAAMVRAKDAAVNWFNYHFQN